MKLKECGAEQVEVSDNGKGVEEDNFEGLSKCQICQFALLVQLCVFGYGFVHVKPLSSLLQR